MTIRFDLLHQKSFIVLLTILVACIILTLGLDVMESNNHDSSFYFSESFLFSSFWWLFIPLLYAQYYIAKEETSAVSVLLRLVSPIVIHLFAYPSLVWLISRLFFNHAFSYLQTFHYGLTEYSFILCMVYTVPILLYTSFKSKLSSKSYSSGVIDSANRTNYITNIIVMDGMNRTNIHTKDILYISSNPPYINIHHPSKRYIQKDTLKSISEKLDTELFVRVHKSTIVNIAKVQSYRSRLNGDYDLVMHDGTEIRLSRNFTPNFKQQFSKTHQDTP